MIKKYNWLSNYERPIQVMLDQDQQLRHTRPLQESHMLSLMEDLLTTAATGPIGAAAGGKNTVVVVPSIKKFRSSERGMTRSIIIF